MIIKTIAEAEAGLQAYVPVNSLMTPKDTTLDRINPLMELLGNPQDQLRIVHIAGTSGKTSTAYYMAALLTAAGQKTGLTVSPHIDSITERIQIDGKPISDELFCSELNLFLKATEQVKIKPSYFELLYALAIWILARQKVDYAVVETGVGGLHDATNIAGRPDKVCVITDIGFDHMHLLGNTLPEIAAQKIGIVHDGNHTLTYQQNEESMDVFREWNKDHHAELQIIEANVTDNYDFEPDMPEYQRRNWALAYKFYEYLANRDSLHNLTSNELQTTQHVQVPARMQIQEVHGKTIVMDGAHNVAKMTAFITSFQKLYPEVKPVVLLALKEDKDYASLVPIIGNFAEHIIITTFNTTQDLPVRSLDPNELAGEFERQGFAAEAITDQAEAIKRMLSEKASPYVITGSFYLLSQIRKRKLLV